jgi:tetratricopeptide (TPR) repeat protein
MGEVLRGHDLHLGRDLAVKVLLPQHRDEPHLVQRFLAEARIHGRLQHPGIAPVHELGELPDHRPYFTMKLVEGRTLAVLLDQRAEPSHDLARFLTIFEQVCQAVGYAHSKGVIHRDLKPHNVMVGSFGEVQVMDWGLAKALDRDRGGPAKASEGAVAPGRPGRGGDSGQATQPGTVLGTPAYMAPEQARGEGHALDERCDVFGLGAVLCVILTGQPPYAGGDADEVLSQATRAELDGAFARLGGCGADAELVALCRACLAPDPRERPRDGGAVAARVAAYQAAVQQRLRQAELDRTAAQARAAESKATAAVERKARRRTRGLATAVLALVVVGAGGGLWVQHQAAERQAEQVRRDAERREEQARRDAEQRQTVESALDKAAGLRKQAHWGEAQAVLDQARQVLGEAGPDDLRRRLEVAEAELALVRRLDAIRQSRATWVGRHFDYQTVERDYAAAFRDAGLGEVGDDEEAVAQRVRASGVAGPLVAALDDWASVVRDFDTGSWLLGVARRAAPDLWGDRFRDPAAWRDRRALRALADEALRDGGAKLDELSPPLLTALGRMLGEGAEAVALLGAAQRRYPNDFWLSLVLSNALHNTNKDEEALGYCRVAVALRPDAAAAHDNLGNALAAKQDLDGAIAAYRQAIELDPRRANTHSNLGVALRAKGDVDGAIAAYQKAIDIDPGHANAHDNLGNALHAKGDLDGAIAAHRQAIELDPRRANTHSNLGVALRAKGDVDGAIAAYQKAIELDPKDAKAHIGLGNALRDKQDLDGAIAAYQKAIELNPKGAIAYGALGRALLERGFFAEARTATRRSLELLPESDPLRQLASQQLQRCERLLALDEKLSAVLDGQTEPADAAERLTLAQLCQRYKRLYAAAARFYAGAFAADPKLADDLRQQHRYSAARSAALAAGQSEGGRNLPDKVQLRLRRQALQWLRADLALYAKQMEHSEPAVKQAVRERLAHWQQDTDLASVRDRAALENLPEDERRPWRRLWADVAALLAKAGATP